MPAVLCKSARELFDAFIVEQLPRLRAAAGPLAVAAPGSTDRVALLIEPRCHPALEHVVRNAMHFLGEGWQLQIFHGTENEAFLREAFSADELRDVQLISLEVDNLSPLAHNELMCTHWLWQRAAAEHVLIFQTDALLLRRGVDEFLRWDYIGAPWRTDDLWCVGKPHLMEAGNGGLSLRSRARTLETLDRFGYSRGQSEDVFYVEHLPKAGGKLAPRAEATRFAVESDWAAEYDETPPLGFHAAYRWLTSEQMLKLLRAVEYAEVAAA